MRAVGCGAETVTYQWYRDGSLITGAAASTYTAASAGRYHVRAASGALPAITSESVTITGNGLGFNLTHWDFSGVVREGFPRLRGLSGQ